MKTTIKAYLYHLQYEWSENANYVLDSNPNMGESSPNWALIREENIEVDIPDDFDPTPQKIANLKKAKEAVLAEAHVKANNIEDQIQRLLYIEHKPDLATTC